MGYNDLSDTGGGAGFEANMPTQPMLVRIRMVAEAMVQALGGSYWEAEQVADELVAYVDFNWHALRLHVLSHNPELWERHLLRAVFQRWLGVLNRLSGEGPPVRESLTRARVLALADAVDFAPQESAFFDYVFVHGFSLAETAFVFGLDHAELVQRLRQMTAEVRCLAEISQNRT